MTPLVSGEYGQRDIPGMTNRISFSQYRLEAEIEKHRAECQWDKIPSMVEQLAAARFHDDGECALPVAWLVRRWARIPGER